MKRLPVLAVALLLAGACQAPQEENMKMLTPVSFSSVTINDAFWTPRLLIHKNVTLPVCIDQIENQTGRIRNFENAAKGEGEHSGIFFDDSDVYKALEGMAYSLQIEPDPGLEAKCDEWVAKFAAAQQPDGYLNTFYTLTGLENRWHDMDRHEMYCAGHMTEAAVAYYQATGRRRLLEVSERMANHMMSVFGPGKRHWVPGHEEIELALVKLYEVTGEKKYLDFAGWLLDERGHGYGSYGDDRVWPAVYYQDEVPVRELSRITGHAVRSMYLYCGMADVAAYTGDRELMAALDRLWDHVVNRNMYITGGIGQSSRNEGITEDYDLPNLTAYCETCASVGMVFWNWRMNQFTGDAKYIDVMERSLYNGALAGISLRGDRFFYVNPLESLGGHHRQEWFGCACCPSQICRFIPSVGNYAYATSEKALWVNLYMGSDVTVNLAGKEMKVHQTTAYPWDGSVALELGLQKPVKGEIRLRIPGWCKDYTVAVNGSAVSAPVEKGYVVLRSKWKDKDKIELVMTMPVEVVAADPRVKEDEGKRAVQRGPIVYCIEEVDNPEGFDNLALSEGMDFKLEKLPKRQWWGHEIMQISARTGEGEMTLIPYFAWDNREAGKMKVWIPFND
ncbi:MAG: glycoside hydrolase family 127 protein [Bacteroidales bacterium]|nr:glycoside hydrolase family 127 protein [Bacteroidales bacterium]